MAIIGIVAVGKNGAIGKDGGLPWRLPADMKFFREQTTGHACVMGYRTWRSLQRPLRERLNIVLSRRAEITPPQDDVLVLRDTMSVLSLRKYLACDLFIIGGAEVYRAFLSDVDKWLVTEVPLAVEDADAFMPDGYLDGFRRYDSRELDDDLRVGYYARTDGANLV